MSADLDITQVRQDIAQVRRDMPRNTRVLTICDLAEAYVTLRLRRVSADTDKDAVQMSADKAAVPQMSADISEDKAGEDERVRGQVKCPVCEARKAADAARKKKHRGRGGNVVKLRRPADDRGAA